jgi:hypothetical protein
MRRISKGSKGGLQKRLTARLVLVLAFSLVILSQSPRLHAQAITGINGTVVDSSGAVIPGARVTATDVSTGVKSDTTTSSAGTFTIVGIIPGTYSVVVEAKGFKSAQENVTVEVAKISTTSFRMAVGATSSRVEVKASALTLQTTSPVIGTTLEPELVKTAPIEINSLVRQIDSFMYLAPGVQGSSNSHYINGGVNYENETLFNGVPVAFVDYEGNQTYVNPPYEAVNEFRVNSSTFNAQYGLGQGSVTFNMASGTNDLHGDAFEILRNQTFDSVGFFPTNFGAEGKPIPPVDQQNDYGFTVGGPVYIPKVYNGRNRTFFYFSLDLFKQNLAQNQIGTVPTVAMRSGDFSNFVNSSGTQIPIYDPETGQPFPGNIIPTSRFSALAKSVLPDIPNPDRAGLDSGNLDNESPAVHSVPVRQHVWSYTLNHNISSSQNISFSEWRNTVTEPSFSAAPIVPFSNPLQSGSNNLNLTNAFLVNYVKTIRPNLVTTVGADWIGYTTEETNANMSVSFPGVAGSTTFPLINFDGNNAPTSWGASGGAYLQCCEGGLTQLDNRRLGIVLANNWVWTTGRNTFNFGGEFRRTFQDIIACQFCSGTFNFSQRTTSTPNSNDPNFGSDGSSFASFLLGEADSGERIMANKLYFRNKEFAAYFQDDIKVNKRLTVDLGARYDIMVPFTESHNNIVFMDPTEPDPGAGGRLGAATKFGNCAACSGITRADIHWKYVQPRVGFAYMVSPKTVIRSGFYVSMLNGGAYEYGTSQSASFMGGLLDSEFLRSPTGSSTPGYGSWDTTPMPVLTPRPIGPSIANDGTIFAFPPAQVGRAPYDISWNFGVQRELPWNTLLTVSYVGAHDIHLPSTLDLLDQPNPDVLKYGSLLSQLVTSPAAVAAGIKDPYPEFVQQFGGAATVEQALEPYPQFGGYFPVDETGGKALYHALQVQGEKRFSNGLSYLADFTLSRNVADVVTGSAPFAPNGVNAWDPKLEYAPSSLDQFYVTNFVASYELPIGAGKRFLNSGGMLSRLAGGWQVSGIFTYSGGFPFGPINSFNPLLVNSFDRPNIVPGAKLQTYNYNLSKPYLLGGTQAPPVQFTTNAFVNTGPWQVGDSLRAYAALRTPPLRIEDFALMKYFPITEQVKATLRFDFFNAFNRTQLQGPDTNSLDSTFGEITNLSSQISNRIGQATFRLEW